MAFSLFVAIDILGKSMVDIWCVVLDLFDHFCCHGVSWKPSEATKYSGSHVDRAIGA